MARSGFWLPISFSRVTGSRRGRSPRRSDRSPLAASRPASVPGCQPIRRCRNGAAGPRRHSCDLLREICLRPTGFLRHMPKTVAGRTGLKPKDRQSVPAISMDGTGVGKVPTREHPACRLRRSRLQRPRASRPMCFKSGPPVIGILVSSRIVHAGQMEGFSPLDAGATAPAMTLPALVAGPRLGEGRSNPCAL